MIKDWDKVKNFLKRSTANMLQVVHHNSIKATIINNASRLLQR